MTNIETHRGGIIKVYSHFNVHEEQIVNVIRGSLQNCLKHVMQTVTNRIVGKTLPNKSLGKELSKQGTMKLRQRIRRNFTMNGDYLRTYPNNYGKPIFDEGVAEGKSMLPVIVVKKYVGRPKKGRKINKPDRIYEPQALLSYINRYTEFRRKKDAVMRYKKHGVKCVWTTKENLYRASKMEEQRAGNNIFGWNSLAEKVGSAAMRKTLNLTGGNFDKPGGTASIAPSTYSPVDSIKINAYNNNVPADKQSYNQAVIDANIPKWVNDAFSKELKYMTPAKLLKGVPIPPDVKIWFN